MEVEPCDQRRKVRMVTERSAPLGKEVSASSGKREQHGDDLRSEGYSISTIKFVTWLL